MSRSESQELFRRASAAVPTVADIAAKRPGFLLFAGPKEMAKYLDSAGEATAEVWAPGRSSFELCDKGPLPAPSIRRGGPAQRQTVEHPTRPFLSMQIASAR